MEGEETNWSETVEDLVRGGEVDKAISLLESVASKLETLNSTQFDHLQLSSALFDLSKLYSSKGFSLKADEARSRALLARERCHKTHSPPRDFQIAKDSGKICVDASPRDGLLNDDGHFGKSTALLNDALPSRECPDDATFFLFFFGSRTVIISYPLFWPFDYPDWEAIADRAPEELLSPQRLTEVSKLSLEDTKIQTPKRRGRGMFSYTTHGLYSDQQPDGHVDYSETEAACHSSEGDTEIRNLKYGTRHVLVLADFSPSTKTVDLEKLFEKFKDQGVVIRWVNDTVALAVFRKPAIALEAFNHIRCPFTVRILDEDDMLLSSIPPRDLEPPRQRPETSTRTARRLIAQGMGIMLPPANFGSRELRKQEEARKNRIISRQSMRADAWGDEG